MGYVKDSFKAKADEQVKEIKSLLEKHGNKELDKVTLAQAYQGMRGIPGLVTETSLLDSNEGIRFRGYSIPELREKLPKAEGGNEPLPEGLFYLMLVGDVPSKEDVYHLMRMLIISQQPGLVALTCQIMFLLSLRHFRYLHTQ